LCQLLRIVRACPFFAVAFCATLVRILDSLGIDPVQFKVGDQRSPPGRIITVQTKMLRSLLPVFSQPETETGTVTF
jgi:hypothetical protein